MKEKRGGREHDTAMIHSTCMETSARVWQWLRVKLQKRLILPHLFCIYMGTSVMYLYI